MARKNSVEKNVLADVEEVDDSVVEVSENTPDVPSPSSPEWHDFVMNQFQADEMDDEGHPNIYGLRRVAKKLLGKVIMGSGRIVQCPNPDNENRAVAEYRLVYVDLEGDQVEITDAADAHVSNALDLKFSIYPTALAVTRAEGRVLRKVLGLKVVAAEEVTDKKIQEVAVRQAEENMSNATDQQIKLIDVQCKKLDINVMKFVNLGTAKYLRVEDVPREKAATMIKYLNQWVNTNKVPDEHKKILGYDPNWRN